jgi:hypothetical protein
VLNLLAAIKGRDRLLDTGNLPLVRGEVLVNGLCRKERTTAAGSLGENLKAPLRVRTHSHGQSS